MLIRNHQRSRKLVTYLKICCQYRYIVVNLKKKIHSLIPKFQGFRAHIICMLSHLHNLRMLCHEILQRNTNFCNCSKTVNVAVTCKLTTCNHYSSVYQVANYDTQSINRYHYQVCVNYIAKQLQNDCYFTVISHKFYTILHRLLDNLHI